MKRSLFLFILALLYPLLSFGETYKVYHTVKKGENLSIIANKYGKTIEDIKKLNNLNSDKIYPGQKLIVLIKENKLEKTDFLLDDTKYEKLYYTVKKGDTLFEISRRFNISINQLKKLNNLKSSKLMIGQKLIVGIKKKEEIQNVKIEINPDEIKPITEVTKKTYYKVGEGDTLNSICEKFGIEPEKLLKANLIKEDELKVGQILVIPPKEIIDESLRKETSIEQHISIRTKIIEEALKYLGVRYVYGGESKNGVDCSGLVRSVYKAIGLLLPQNSSEQYKNGIEIRESDAMPGDLVFFKRGSHIGHVGIYLGNDLFVHASYTLKRVVISSLSEKYFKDRFVGFRRYLNGETTFFAKGEENVN